MIRLHPRRTRRALEHIHPVHVRIRIAARGEIAGVLGVACPNPREGKNAAMEMANPVRLLDFSIYLTALILSCGIAVLQDMPGWLLRSKRVVC